MSSVSCVPTEFDWTGCENDPDASWSYRLFFGKSAEEVVELFEANVVDSAENIHRMPQVPFEYYLMAFARYVMSIDASNSYSAADAASCLLNYVLLNLQQEPSKLRSIYSDLLPIVEAVASAQEKYDAPDSIYGSFAKTRDEIVHLAAVNLKF